jgi:hypothetical protein
MDFFDFENEPTVCAYCGKKINCNCEIKDIKMGNEKSFFESTKHFKMGKDFEDRLKVLFKERGFEVQESTEEENKFKHIDFYVKGTDGRQYSIDAKAMKSIDHGQTYQDVYTYVEFKNVRGNPGWIYGEVDFFAFERKSSTIIISQKNLLAFSLSKVDLNKRVYRLEDAHYKVYGRPSRKDLFSLIKLDDLPKDKIKVFNF